MVHALLIHQAFVSPNEAGGTRHFEFAQRMLKGGDRFTIVASTLSYLTGENVNGARGWMHKEVNSGVDVIRTYTLKTLHKSFVWRVGSFLSFSASSVVGAMKAKDVDVVMGTSPPIFQAASALVVASLKRRPFLLEVRDLWPDFAIEMGVLENKPLIEMSKWLEAFLYKQAAHIIVNSPAYERILIDEKGVPADKVTLIPNGVDPAMFDPEAKDDGFRKEVGLEKKHFVITYAGALGMANDIPTILQAAHLVQDDEKIRFLIVGDGKERKNLENQAQQMGLKNLIFAGSRKKSEMGRVLAASDACVACLQDIPLFKTTYPNKVFDYMAAARPTLLGIDGVIRDVVESAKGGLYFQPGSAESLANAAKELAAHPRKAKNMGKRARDYVVENFNRAKHADAFRNVVLAVANGEKPARSEPIPKLHVVYSEAISNAS